MNRRAVGGCPACRAFMAKDSMIVVAVSTEQGLGRGVTRRVGWVGVMKWPTETGGVEAVARPSVDWRHLSSGLLNLGRARIEAKASVNLCGPDSTFLPRYLRVGWLWLGRATALER